MIDERAYAALINTIYNAVADALHRLEQGALLVDKTAGVVFANREAERLLVAGGGLRVTEGVLSADSAADTTLLHTLIAGCVRNGAEAGAGGSLPLSRGPDRAPLSLLVAPLRSEAPQPSMTQRPVAILFVTDPTARPDRRLHGFRSDLA